MTYDAAESRRQCLGGTLPEASVRGLASVSFSEEEWIAALTGLGLTKSTAKKMLKNIPQDVSLDQAIQMALYQRHKVSGMLFVVKRQLARDGSRC